ncbi:uncharacterized protein LAJ45_09151 [Morchella importuna]|uniref:uncharacterized protein n=1 Tax=Morchella importuna TaxID=1174673 RepID=UPI001E8E7657|nr:uncharacterized protein LAJ45_09151 [Morchella importuna]KAH8146777.1 hypothetical protein LAJ45_09151 [Morchella importuna]
MLPHMKIAKLLLLLQSRPGGRYISFQNLMWFLEQGLIIATRIFQIRLARQEEAKVAFAVVPGTLDIVASARQWCC